MEEICSDRIQIGFVSLFWLFEICAGGNCGNRAVGNGSCKLANAFFAAVSGGKQSGCFGDCHFSVSKTHSRFRQAQQDR